MRLYTVLCGVTLLFRGCGGLFPCRRVLVRYCLLHAPTRSIEFALSAVKKKENDSSVCFVSSFFLVFYQCFFSLLLMDLGGFVNLCLFMKKSTLVKESFRVGKTVKKTRAYACGRNIGLTVRGECGRKGCSCSRDSSQQLRRCLCSASVRHTP